MVMYQKMYCVLFNAISGVLEDLDGLNIGLAKKKLKEAQQRTEEIYMIHGGENPPEE